MFGAKLSRSRCFKTLSSGKPPSVFLSQTSVLSPSPFVNQTRKRPAVSSELSGTRDIQSINGGGKVKKSSVCVQAARWSQRHRSQNSIVTVQSGLGHSMMTEKPSRADFAFRSQQSRRMVTVTGEGSTKWTVHVEVRLQPRATARFETIRNRVYDWISSFQRINLGTEIIGWKDDIPELASSIERIAVSESPSPSQSLSLDDMILQIHVYQPSDSQSFEEFSTLGDSEDDTMAASVCELPNRNWEGLWDSLIYADDIKMRLLDYIHATLILSDANVDFNLVSWNRVVLLHGPPGTGKTSLCRALAQKLSIRLSHRYSHARLLEINSHSLFSKWFSESGKLVQRLFTSITEIADEDDAFLVVLIDEVESLTAARAGAMAGTEPSDGLRVVNALLTQLDKLKHRRNVLIMTTSNLVKAIDTAFVDRADIIQYIDLPSREAIYEILRTTLCEIVSKGIVAPVTVPTLQQAHMYELSALAHQSLGDSLQKSRSVALRLLALAAQCKNQRMSGRALRRLPVLALAKYIGIGSFTLQRDSKANGAVSHYCGADVDIWLDGIERVVKEHSEELTKLM